MTGYDNINHWEECRLKIFDTNNESDELWDRVKALRDRLEDITIERSLNLVKSIVI